MGQLFSSHPSYPSSGLISQIPEEIKIDYSETSPRFSVYNTEELEQGVVHLNEHGYAIFSNVLNSNEIKNSMDLLWEYLEDLKSPYHIRRDNPETWDEPWPGATYIGILNDLGIGQSEFIWYVRGNPNIKKVFSHIWDSNELFVSFDGAGCFRNWHLNKHWKTTSGWYHCDQNPFKKPNRCSIQGLVSITDSDESTGGLVLVPDSHKHFLDLLSVIQEQRLHGDFARIPYGSPLLKKLRPRLIKCKAGDLIVWDSRCIHCNTPALVDQNQSNQSELLRLVTYICMSPLSMFTPNEETYKNIEEFRRLREKYVRERITCTHWPLELIGAGRKSSDENKPLKLNAYQHSLIVGTNVEPDKGVEEIIF